MDSLLQLTLVLSAIVAALGFREWLRRPDTYLYSVGRDGGDGLLPGIPFFVKKARHLHRTSYLEAMLELSLEAVTVSGRGDSARRDQLFVGTRLVRWPDQATEIDELERLLDAVAGSTDQVGIFQQAREQFRALKSPEQAALLPENLILESNTVAQEVYVDFSETHYINTRQPRSGSAETTVEIGTDGTLSKAVAKIDDKTLSTLSGMLPISKLVEKRLAAPSPDQPPTRGFAPEIGPAVRVEITYKRTPFVVRHTLSKLHRSQTEFVDQPIAWPLELSSYAGGYLRELVSEEPEEPEAPATAPKPVGAGKPGASGVDPADRIGPPLRSLAAGTRAMSDISRPTALYSPGGGPLTLVVECRHAHSGTYTLRLWDGDQRIDKRPELEYEDEQDLGTGVSQRAIDCVATVVRLGDPGTYFLAAKVFQNGEQIGEDICEGIFDGVRVTKRVTLFMEEA